MNGMLMSKGKSVRLLVPLFIVILGLLQTHCHRTSGENAGLFFSDFEQAEQDALILFKVVRLGATYSEVHKHVPGLGELTPEGGSEFLASQGLTEAAASTKLFDTATALEFNFEKGHLYSYSFFLRDLEGDTAGRLYHRIKEFYSSSFGHGAEEEDKGDRLLRSIVWTTSDLEAVVTLIAANETCTLSWGFQQPGPNAEYFPKN